MTAAIQPAATESASYAPTTEDEWIDAAIAAMPRPTPEVAARLAALLGLDRVTSGGEAA